MANGNDGEPDEEKTDRRHSKDRRDYKKKKSIRDKQGQKFKSRESKKVYI